MLRSRDKGQTWSVPILGPTITSTFQPNGNTGIIDPETGQYLLDPGDPAFAEDPRNGSLYAVWEDARLNNSQYDDIVFSMSSEGGLTWSTPIRVNQTPPNIPALNRQAFLPSLAVLGDGTIGVSYYDFRFNDPNPGLPTDYWMAQCHPTSTAPATNPANWGKELRLTASSFDFEAVVVFDETFLGDLCGWAGAFRQGIRRGLHRRRPERPYQHFWPARRTVESPDPNPGPRLMFSSSPETPWRGVPSIPYRAQNFLRLNEWLSTKGRDSGVLLLERTFG